MRVELLSLSGSINELTLDCLITVPSYWKSQNNCFLLHRHLHLNVDKMVKSSVHNLHAGECRNLIFILGTVFAESNIQNKMKNIGVQ